MLKRSRISKLPSGAWGVDLPTYIMIAGTFLPIVQGLIDADGLSARFSDEDCTRLNPTVQIEIPDDWPLDAEGQLDAEELRAMYREHPYFGAASFVPPVFLD